MKYFILELDKNYIAPSPRDWYGKIDNTTLNNKKLFEFSKHMFFYVEDHMQMMFTDIIKFPSFMVSNEAKKTIMLYDPFIQFLRVILISKSKKESEAYYIPFLPKVDCLLEGSILNQDKSVISHARIDKNKLFGINIAFIDNVNCSSVLISLDLAESLLRRKLTGIGLKETESV